MQHGLSAVWQTSARDLIPKRYYVLFLTLVFVTSLWSAYALLPYVARRQVVVAIFSDGWNNVPASWIRVGGWEIDHNVIAASSAISFFAPDAAQAAILADHLVSYETARLPDGVRCTWEPEYEP